MQLPKGFKLRDGLALQGTLPRPIVVIMKYLDTVDFQEVLTGFQLSQAISHGQSYIHGSGRHPALKDYRYQTPQRLVLWGNKRTIASLKKQLRKQSEQE